MTTQRIQPLLTNMGQKYQRIDLDPEVSQTPKRHSRPLIANDCWTWAKGVFILTPAARRQGKNKIGWVHSPYRAYLMRQYHFLHIGKTGGTAIKAALRPVASELGITLHKHKARLCDIPRGDGVFFTRRDPISRFVSGFYSRQRKGQPRYFSEWRKGEKIAFETFQTANALAEGLSSTSTQTREAAEHAMRSITHIKRRFRYWFKGTKELEERGDDIVLIAFQETLDQDFEALKSLLGLPKGVHLPPQDDHRKSHRNPDTVDRRLSPCALANLRIWYESDLRLYETLRHSRWRPALGLQEEMS